MNNYYLESKIPEIQNSVIKTLCDENKMVGITIPKSFLETLPKTTTDKPITTNSHWSSKIIELDFESLTDILKTFERDLGFSTIEMLHHYLNGELSDDPRIDYWVNTFILYLGTNQVHQYSSP